MNPLKLDLEAAGPSNLTAGVVVERPRDVPEASADRPSALKQRARVLLREAASLADACPRQFAWKKRRADVLLGQRWEKLRDLDRAVSHSATLHTAAAWGERPGEPLPEFPRALRRTLLELGIEKGLADQIIDTRAGEKGGEKGHKKMRGRGKGKK